MNKEALIAEIERLKVSIAQKAELQAMLKELQHEFCRHEAAVPVGTRHWCSSCSSYIRSDKDFKLGERVDALLKEIEGKK